MKETGLQKTTRRATYLKLNLFLVSILTINGSGLKSVQNVLDFFLRVWKMAFRFWEVNIWGELIWIRSGQGIWEQMNDYQWAKWFNHSHGVEGGPHVSCNICFFLKCLLTLWANACRATQELFLSSVWVVSLELLIWTIAWWPETFGLSTSASAVNVSIGQESTCLSQSIAVPP